LQRSQNGSSAAIEFNAPTAPMKTSRLHSSLSNIPPDTRERVKKPQSPGLDRAKALG
jgi:hypothetical protein